MESLNEFIENLIRKSQKIKGKFLPISKKEDGNIIQYEVKSIYSLADELRNKLMLFKFKNPEKPPKHKYFLSIVLASQSSDFLVLMCKEMVKKSQMLLIQYPLKPEQYRLSLICLKELSSTEDFLKLKQKLIDIYYLLQNRLIKIAENTN